MKLHQITRHLEHLAPVKLQEAYDNSGLITGSPDMEITGILVSLDCTEAIIEEALSQNCNMVVSHHPVIFKGLKSLTGKNYVERTVLKAIKHDVAIYAIHTNLDNVLRGGVNGKIAQRLGLTNVKILQPKEGMLLKLAVFVPETHADQVRTALFDAGAGQIGNYDSCSFNSSGVGTFKGDETTNPFAGTQGELHRESEIKVEVVLYNYQLSAVVASMKAVHPYEEVAYDVHPILNTASEIGSGMIGELEAPMAKEYFLNHLKDSMKTPVVKYTNTNKEAIKTVAICGGSGSFLIGAAKRSKADAYVTGDIKYHEFFDGENDLMICDIGHYESEQFTIELLGDFLSEKIPNFAVILTKAVTNPVHYFY